MVVMRPDGTIYKHIGTLNANGTVNPVAIGGGQISVHTQ